MPEILSGRVILDILYGLNSAIEQDPPECFVPQPIDCSPHQQLRCHSGLERIILTFTFPTIAPYYANGMRLKHIMGLEPIGRLTSTVCSHKVRCPVLWHGRSSSLAHYSRYLLICSIVQGVQAYHYTASLAIEQRRCREFSHHSYRHLIAT